jgi:hypothetical protein
MTYSGMFSETIESDTHPLSDNHFLENVQCVWIREVMNLLTLRAFIPLHRPRLLRTQRQVTRARYHLTKESLPKSKRCSSRFKLHKYPHLPWRASILSHQTRVSAHAPKVTVHQLMSRSIFFPNACSVGESDNVGLESRKVTSTTSYVRALSETKEYSNYTSNNAMFVLECFISNLNSALLQRPLIDFNLQTYFQISSRLSHHRD